MEKEAYKNLRVRVQLILFVFIFSEAIYQLPE